MGIFGSKQEDQGYEPPEFLVDMQAQLLAIFDALHTLSLEAIKGRKQLEETNKLLRELVALGWNGSGRVQETSGGNPGTINGKDHSGEGQGSVRI